MHKILWLLAFISFYTVSCAQSHIPVNDNISCPPNTIKAIGQIKKVDKQSATIKIVKIIAQGQGLINPLSEGEEVIVKVQEKTKISKGLMIEACLKEKIEIDASQSTYVLTSFVKKKSGAD